MKVDFLSITRSCLRFLIQRGFIEEFASSSIISFRKQNVVLEVGYEWQRSYELICSISLSGDNEEYYVTVGEIARECGMESSQNLDYVEVTSEAVLQKFLLQMSEVLQKCAEEYLRGNPTAFAQLVAKRDASKRDASM